MLFDVLVRRFVSPETRERASQTASVTLQVTATIYAILIAFVIVDAYGQLRDTQEQISQKASSLAIVYENSRDLPDPAGTAIRSATLDYARAVVARGIPRLEETDEPDLPTDRALEKLFRRGAALRADLRLPDARRTTTRSAPSTMSSRPVPSSSTPPAPRSRTRCSRCSS